MKTANNSEHSNFIIITNNSESFESYLNRKQFQIFRKLLNELFEKSKYSENLSCMRIREYSENTELSKDYECSVDCESYELFESSLNDMLFE